jgi:hypothetical protein
MAPVDEFARTLALVSVVFSALSLWWSMVSFRRGGSHLRVVALLYDEVLVIWVFNAGRTADNVERVVLGGRRGGSDGYDLTDVADAPFTLTPGESKRLELPTSALPTDRVGAARAGWTSVWLLLGSMRQRRAEVLPLNAPRPAPAGWRLAPRTAGARRYLPAVMAVSAFACSVPGLPRTLGGVTIGVVVVARVYLAMTFGSGFRRQQVERWFCAAAIPAAGVAAAVPQAAATGWVLALYVLGAVVLGVPGGVESLLRERHRIRARLTELRTGVRRRIRRG